MGLLRTLAKRALGRGSASEPAAPPTNTQGVSPGTIVVQQPPPHLAPPPAVPPSGEDKAGTDKPWYLDGSNDGWDTTDVKKE